MRRTRTWQVLPDGTAVSPRGCGWSAGGDGSWDVDCDAPEHRDGCPAPPAGIAAEARELAEAMAEAS